MYIWLCVTESNRIRDGKKNHSDRAFAAATQRREKETLNLNAKLNASTEHVIESVERAVQNTVRPLKRAPTSIKMNWKDGRLKPQSQENWDKTTSSTKLPTPFNTSYQKK